MTKLEMLSAAGWGAAGLLALRMVIAAQPAASAPLTPGSRGPVVETIRTKCELPAGTVVFVVRDRAEEAP